MTLIQLLSRGTDKDRRLEQHMKTAVEQVGIECRIEEITDIAQIAMFGVVITPAFAVNGQVISMAVVPTVEQIVDYLTNLSPV